MSPERKAAIIEALIANEEDLYMAYAGGDVDMPTRDEHAAEITDEQIGRFDAWLRAFPQ